MAIAALAASGCSSGAKSTKSTDTSVSADQDVTISSCAPSENESEGYLAKISVTNHAAEADDYVVTVTFIGPDGVHPGQTLEEDTPSAKDDLSSIPGLTCKITSASRSVAG